MQAGSVAAIQHGDCSTHPKNVRCSLVSNKTMMQIRFSLILLVGCSSDPYHRKTIGASGFEVPTMDAAVHRNHREL